MTNDQMERRLSAALDKTAPDDVDGVLSRCTERKGTVVPAKKKNNRMKKWMQAVAACLAVLLLGGGGLLVQQSPRRDLGGVPGRESQHRAAGKQPGKGGVLPGPEPGGPGRAGEIWTAAGT